MEIGCFQTERIAVWVCRLIVCLFTGRMVIVLFNAIMPQSISSWMRQPRTAGARNLRWQGILSCETTKLEPQDRHR